MLIGICGGICAGKNTVAQYLIDHHGFTRLTISSLDSSSSSTTTPVTTMASSMPPTHQTVFATAEDLRDYVTIHWRHRFVTLITSHATHQVLSQRPFFLLMSIDAPITVRWARYQARLSSSSTTTFLSTSSPTSSGPLSSLPPLTDLPSFLAFSDHQLYAPPHPLTPLLTIAPLRLLNTSPTLSHLYATLGKLDLPAPSRLRPSWDLYFMSLAALASRRSNCMKRRVGCVLVGPSKRVISTGYNGTPRGLLNCALGGCPRCNASLSSGSSLSTCLCLHAEENALLEAGRERIREGCVLYCDTCPCLTCSIKICQVSISEVVYSQGYSMDTEAADIFRAAGVKLRQFVPAVEGMVDLGEMGSSGEYQKSDTY